MNPFLKWSFLLGLLLASLLASLFMILESGAFYQRLYPADYGFIQLGFLAATLNEIFMAIMAGVWLPGKVKKGRQKGHPVNLLFRLLLVLLFVTTVGGASFNLVYEKFVILQEQSNNQEVIRVLRSQVYDNQESLETFVKQNQRVNSVLTVRQQQRTKEDLIKALQQKEAVSGIWFEILFVILLRFSVQMANLLCVWLAGWVYRRPSEWAKKKPEPIPSPSEQPEATAESQRNESGMGGARRQSPSPTKGMEPLRTVPQNAARRNPTEIGPKAELPEPPAHLLEETPLFEPLAPRREQVWSPDKAGRQRTEKSSEPMTRANRNASVKTGIPADARRPDSISMASQRVETRRIEANPTPKGRSKPKESFSPKLEVSPESSRMTSERPHLSLSRAAKGPQTQPERADRKEGKEEQNERLLNKRLRVQIVNLLHSRNEGISLSHLAQALRRTERVLSDLLNPRIPHESFPSSELQEILHDLTRMYEEQYAV